MVSYSLANFICCAERVWVTKMGCTVLQSSLYRS